MKTFIVLFLTSVIAGCSSQAALPSPCKDYATHEHIVLIPEDADHCAVVQDDQNHYIPWINKKTGKTDRWYDVARRVMIISP